MLTRTRRPDPVEGRQRVSDTKSIGLDAAGEGSTDGKPAFLRMYAASCHSHSQEQAMGEPH
jgi:hypothetical protein